MEEAGLGDVKLLLFDHNYNYDDKPGQNNYPLNIYADPEANRWADGSAWHSYGGSVTELDEIYTTYPDKDIYFTEASIGEWNYSFQTCFCRTSNRGWIVMGKNLAYVLWILGLCDYVSASWFSLEFYNGYGKEKSKEKI